MRAADAAGEPLLLLGGGSNVVIADDGWPGTVVRVAHAGRAVERRPDGSVLLTVEAGEDWDDVVAATVADGLGGLECLSGIPGRTGATPVQNVGAYGVEIADLLVDVDLYDRRTGAVPPHVPGRRARAWPTAPACSRAATTPSCCGCGSRCPAPAQRARPLPGAGPDARRRAGWRGCRRRRPGRRCSSCAAARAWCSTPADHDTWSAGSFFTNPVRRRGGRARRTRPAGPAGPGRVKVPAAWLIEHAGFRRGHPGPGGRVALSGKHVLALTNRGGGTTADLLALAGEVRDGVRHGSGVALVARAGAGRMPALSRA